MTLIKPQNEWCVLEEIDQEEVKKGLIYLAAANEDVQCCKKGKVLLMGKDAEEFTDARVGDTVLFHHKIGIPFFLEGTRFLLCKAESFYVVFVEEEKE